MIRPYKIGVAGTHSTGKSTFVASLSSALRGGGVRVEAVHASAECASARGFTILVAHTFESTAWMMATAIRLEAEASLTADVIIIDRPVPDALGYLVAALRHTQRSVKQERLERLEAVCAAGMSEYDLLFATELDPATPIGLQRDGDEEFRVAASVAIADILGRLAPDHRVLRNEGVDAEVALAVERALAHARGK